MTSIHPTALIDPAATIHSSVEIGPYCVIGSDVTIGEGTVIHDHVTIPGRTTIGRENVVYPYAIIGSDPQDKKWMGEDSSVEIGDRNVIREQVSIHRGTGNGGGVTRIGCDNFIMVSTHIAHDCTIGDDCVIANHVMLAGHVVLEDGANVGGGVGLHHFVTVGRCAFIGGMSRIKMDVPPYMIVDGQPAAVRAVNIIGMTRKGYDLTQIDAIKESFKRFYKDNSAAKSEQIAGLRSEFSELSSVMRLCDALEASMAGTHGRAREATRDDDKWEVRHEAAPVAAIEDAAR